MAKAGWVGLCMLACMALFAAPAPAAPTSANVYCPSAYTGLMNALTALEGQLDVSISFTQYEKLLATAQTAYNRVPFKTSAYVCVHYVGVPEEQALNNYIDASNSWAACNRRIFAGLSQSCVDTGSYGEASRQVFWARASAALAKAVNNLS